MASDNQLQDVNRTSLDNIKNLVDSDTIIGTPIETKAGTTLIPISKISVGLATGGVDATNEKPVFGGGGGTGLSIKPIAFMVVYEDGTVELLNLGMQRPADPVETTIGFIDRVPEIVEKIKNLFGKKKSEDTETETEKKEN